MKIKLPIIALLFLCITSCATVAPTQNQHLSWQQRKASLSQVTQWELEGIMGIRTQQESLSATLHWIQQRQNYKISLFGPLGTHAFMLDGRPGQVQLTFAEGTRFIAASPEILLAEQTGWQIPVSNLYYWTRGLPVPNLPAQYQFDSDQHLVQLVQGSWQIQYLRYISINGIDLPTKISLTHSGINVKIIISQWKTINQPRK